MIVITIVEVFRPGHAPFVVYVARELSVKDLVHTYDLFRTRKGEQA